MADIFISYARADRPAAEKLANFLKAQQFSVWWDAELVGSDDFTDEILSSLKQAKAVIVIWTQTSVLSRFVRDEARVALHFKKLVAVKEPRLADIEIPLGFQGQHTDDMNNLDQIIKAVVRLGANRAQVAWPVEIANQLNPTIETRAFVRSLTRSNWWALVSGIAFRAPDFQLSSQGLWSSIGNVLGMVGITAGCYYGLRWLIRTLDYQMYDFGKVNLLLGIASIILAAVSWWRLSAMAGQRNFTASRIIGAMFVLAAALASSSFLAWARWYKFVPTWVNKDHEGGMLVLAAIASIAAVWIRIRMAR